MLEDQAPVVQKMDDAIHRTNHYPLDSAIGFPNTYPLDSDLSRAQLFEGGLALNPGLNLTRVSFSCVQKHFLG